MDFVNRHVWGTLHATGYPLYVIYGDGINTGKWFIQKNKFRIIHKCSGNFYSSSFAARESISLAFTDMTDIQLF